MKKLQFQVHRSIFPPSSRLFLRKKKAIWQSLLLLFFHPFLTNIGRSCRRPESRALLFQKLQMFFILIFVFFSFGGNLLAASSDRKSTAELKHSTWMTTHLRLACFQRDRAQNRIHRHQGKQVHAIEGGRLLIWSQVIFWRTRRYLESLLGSHELAFLFFLI